jgi:hypothetical protein
VIVRKPDKEPKQLGGPRLELINRWLPPLAGEPDEAPETAEASDSGSENVVPISKGQSGPFADPGQPATDVERPAGGSVETPAPADGEPGPPADGPRRRGRPRRHVKRRQVHFHVDPEEDELLLAAARQFGSQQKGLIAALRALEEVESLRDEVDRLRRHSERQQQLLVAARSLLEKP